MSFGQRHPQPTREETLARRQDPARAAPKRHDATPLGRYGGKVRPVAAKPQAKRNPVLLEMARGRECLLCEPGYCQCTLGSTVAAHSNLGIHGKAKARKADDQYSVWAGAQAHEALDQGREPRAVKEAQFMAAHLRQVNEWRRIAFDASEPVRFRQAAQWALRELRALPEMRAT